MKRKIKLYFNTKCICLHSMAGGQQSPLNFEALVWRIYKHNSRATSSLRGLFLDAWRSEPPSQFLLFSSPTVNTRGVSTQQQVTQCFHHQPDVDVKLMTASLCQDGGLNITERSVNTDIAGDTWSQQTRGGNKEGISSGFKSFTVIKFYKNKTSYQRRRVPECSSAFSCFSSSLCVTRCTGFCGCGRAGGRALYRRSVVTSPKLLPGNRTRVCIKLRRVRVRKICARKCFPGLWGSVQNISSWRNRVKIKTITLLCLKELFF